MYFSTLKELSYEACKLLEEQDLSKYLIGKTVVSIPLSREKEKTRGFNQVDIIADKICRQFKIKKQNSILNRVKDTTAQHSYGREQRFSNIEGCFYAKKSEAKNKDILVIDDISTTGATLLEASKVLLEAGAKSVICFALSKKI
jgi:ComF family protein